MDDKVQGLVLQAIPYGDTSLVVKVYTLNYGLQSYLVKASEVAPPATTLPFFSR